jgi:hypothetical protein
MSNKHSAVGTRRSAKTELTLNARERKLLFEIADYACEMALADLRGVQGGSSPEMKKLEREALRRIDRYEAFRDRLEALADCRVPTAECPAGGRS